MTFEQTTFDFLTQPLLNDSPVLFLEPMDQDQPPTNSEQIEHNSVSPKERTHPEITNDISSETLPPQKKTKYKIMKDPDFLLHLYIHYISTCSTFKTFTLYE